MKSAIFNPVIIYCLFFLPVLVLPLNSQELPDKRNYTDQDGQRQGLWERRYPDGTLQYRGYFRNNHPVGELMRYFPNGNKMAVMNFCESGINAKATLFYQDGTLAAEGNYVNEKKDSVWRYYSYYDNRLASIETWNNGIKHGVSSVFYENGKVSESVWYKNDSRNGPWRQYYENGSIRTETLFDNDQRNGVFKFYSPSGRIEISGQYLNNQMEGEWTYFDEFGQAATVIIYVDGRPENEDYLINKEQDIFRRIEEMRGRIPEPDESELFYPGRR
jgi:antitoxin component YwqK of YwqJK toxin-antitoxin module